MFAKLLKYDLKSMLKVMLPLWITVIILGGFLGLALSSEHFDGMFVSMLFSSGAIYPMEFLILVLFGVFVAMFVMNIIIVIRRFWDGLLKDEGYLMFTLPVSVRKLIFSKFVSALIVTLLSMIAGYGVIAMILLFSVQGHVMDLFYEVGEAFSFAGGEERVFMILMIVNIALAVMTMIYRVYAAMALGHLSNNNKFLFSFLAFIGLNIVISVISTPIMAFVLTKVTNASVATLISIVQDLIMIVIFHTIVEIVLSTRLNLE
ncbi:MAG: hypothetical protein MJ087_00870 [Lachnospiraceae bacterium]|nr:hypothetical protein [Lachnospiraceae bacterium]